MAIGENGKKEEGKGFAGLSSLVSDVDTTPPQEPTAAPSAPRSAPQPTQLQPQPQPTQHQTEKAPTQPSSDLSGGKWLLGIIVVIGVIIWLGSHSDNTGKSTTPVYDPSKQASHFDQDVSVKKSSESGPPKFNDYLSEPYDGPRANVNLVSDFDNNYRTRIRNTQSQPINFAGEYVLSTWGCGTSCSMGVAVSSRTGRVVALPGTVCCWIGEGERVIFKENSRLLVLAGLINEDGEYGAHFYELKNDQFFHIKTIAVQKDESANASYALTPPLQTYSNPPAQPQAPVQPSESKPPVGQNLVLSREQIRYCLAEDIRLQAAKSTLNNYIDADLNRFNAMVADYNIRCSSFLYHTNNRGRNDLNSAQRDIEPFRSQLQSEGRKRFSDLYSANSFNSINNNQTMSQDFGAATYKTSFDCGKAKSIPEKLICSDPFLAERDIELAKIFEIARDAVIDKSGFRERARNQWNYREKNCKDRECLVAWYEYQKYTLMKIAQTGDVNAQID